MPVLHFIFKRKTKKSTPWVSGFRRELEGPIQDFDKDKTDLDYHSKLITKDILKEVESDSWGTQKQWGILISDELYKAYIEGDWPSIQDDSPSGEDTDENPPPASASLFSNPGTSQSDLVSTVSLILQQQQDSNQQMMSEIVTAMTMLLDRSGSKKMTITKFDGSSEDAKGWMHMYERACDANRWDSDDLKINNLKALLVPSSAADRWFSSRIIDQGDRPWSEWKQAFLEAFFTNKIQSATRALRYEYRHGTLLEYYYEKERLLNMAFSDLGEKSFITHVLLGLPSHLQGQILFMDPKNKSDLKQCLSRVPETTRPKREQNFTQNTTSYQRKPEQTSRRESPVYQQKKNPSQKTNDRKANKVNAVTEESPVNVVNHVKQEDGRELPVYSVDCNGVIVKALLDSGSNMNLISRALVNKHGWKTTPDIKTATAFNGKAITSKDKCDIRVSFSLLKSNGRKNVLIQTQASVFNGISSDLILGYPFLLQAGIELSPVPITSLPVGKTLSVNQQKVDSITDVESIFPGILRENYIPQYEIPFNLNDTSVVQCKPYRLSKERYSWLQTKINSLLDSNFIRPSTSNFASPVVIVTKENGDYRLCIDYRSVNNQTTLFPFPFPIIDDVIVKFGGCNFFSKFDLKDGFNQAGLTEDTKKFTAFVTPFGLFEWNRLPFGWKNSPPFFQKMMTEVLGNLLETPNIAVYLDDIICGAKTQEENQQLTFKVLQRLEEHGMTINLSKCQVNVESVVFLGRKIDGQTKTTKEESVEKVMNMEQPKDLHSLRVFLGLTGHFRAFIPGYADITRPLDHLRKKDAPYAWTEECQQSFTKLKEMITSNPILSLPDWTLEFELCTDASNYGSGSILYQRDPSQRRNKQLRVIGYQSYTFTAAEVKYSVTEKECLAVIKAIEYFKSYLEGKQFVVNSDHSALTSLLTLKEAKNRLGRWQTKLLSYDMKINHRKGIALKDADAISRLCLDVSPPSSLQVNNVISKDDNETKRLILKRYHDDADSGGHDGKRRLFYKISQRFQWSNMRRDIDNYVDSCHECQLKKFKYRKKFNFLTVVNHGSNPYETIHLDFAELQKKTEGVKKTKSFILLVDEFTRMVHTKAIGMTSGQLIKWLQSIPFFPSVKRIITDNGKTFDSKEFKDFLEKKGIKLTFSSPYHPPGNGMAERHIQEIKLFLSLYPNYSGGWKNCLSAATQHHNRSYCSSIGCTPLFKLTGEPTSLPADKEFNINIEDMANKESCLSDDKQRTNQQKVVDKANEKQGKIPEINPGDQIVFQAGYKGKDPIVKGPVTVDKVIERDNIPKTLIIQEGKQKKAVALKNALPYKQRLLTSLALIACICLLSQPMVEGLLSKESPLIWTRSSAPVFGQVQHMQHTVVVQVFCKDFMVLPDVPPETREFLARWCWTKMDTFWQPFREICSTNETSHQIQKRLIDPISVSVLTVALTILFATSATALTVAWKDQNRIDVNRKNIDSMRQHNVKNSEYLDQLIGDLVNITQRVEQLEVSFQQLYRVLPKMETVVAEVTSTFLKRELLSNDVRRSWMNKRISHHFFDLFEIRPPGNLILEETEAISCVIKEKEGYLTFDYLLPSKNPSLEMFEANPFEMKVKNTDMNKTCIMLYEGPKFALVSKNCVYAIHSDSNHIRRTAFIFSEEQTCPQKSLTDEKVYWTQGRCYDVDSFIDQVKLTTSKNFIYCPGHTIQIQNHKEICPNYVFSLPAGIDFVLNSFNYSGKTFLNVKNFSIIDHLRINSFIFPDTHKELSLIPGLEHLRKEIKQETTGFITSMNPFYTPTTLNLILFVIILLLVMVFSCVCYCYFKSLCKSPTEISPVVQRMKMQPLPRIVSIEEA